MERNQIFTYTAPNGVEVTAVVVYRRNCTRFLFPTSTQPPGNEDQYVAYAQNRLFTCTQVTFIDGGNYIPQPIKEGFVLVDYCIIPEYDDMLRNAT